MDKPLIFSELGAEALAGFHDLSPSPHKFSEEYQADFYRQNLKMAAKIPFLRGMSPWILKDFRSPRRQNPVYQQGWNRKGLESPDRGPQAGLRRACRILSVARTGALIRAERRPMMRLLLALMLMAPALVRCAADRVSRSSFARFLGTCSQGRAGSKSSRTESHGRKDPSGSALAAICCSATFRRTESTKWAPGKAASVFIEPSGPSDTQGLREPGTNGLKPGPRGFIIAAGSGDRAVALVNLATKAKRLLAERFEGKRLNSPNDLAVGPDGSIWFTDPPYGLEGIEKSPLKEQAADRVYRLSPDGEVAAMVSDLRFPNGIAFSPDGRTLYVSNSDPKNALILAWDVSPTGTLSRRRVFADMTALAAKGLPGLPDGMTVDERGNLWASGPGGIHVLAPDGRELGRIARDVAISNCTFGGPDGRTLYMTSTHEVLALRTNVRGAPVRMPKLWIGEMNRRHLPPRAHRSWRRRRRFVGSRPERRPAMDLSALPWSASASWRRVRSFPDSAIAAARAWPRSSAAIPTRRTASPPSNICRRRDLQLRRFRPHRRRPSDRCRLHRAAQLHARRVHHPRAESRQARAVRKADGDQRRRLRGR